MSDERDGAGDGIVIVVLVMLLAAIIGMTLAGVRWSPEPTGAHGAVRP